MAIYIIAVQWEIDRFYYSGGEKELFVKIGDKPKDVKVFFSKEEADRKVEELIRHYGSPYIEVVEFKQV